VQQVGVEPSARNYENTLESRVFSDTFAAFTPAQQVARNKLVARNLLLEATCCAQHATCCGQQSTCCAKHVAGCPQQVAFARNKLRWCKRGIISVTDELILR